MTRPRYVTAYGRTQTVPEWAAETRLTAGTISKRLLRGRSEEYAVTNHLRTRRSSREMWPGANSLSWEEDKAARDLVAVRGAFSLEEIAVMLGLRSWQGVQRIERSAMRAFLTNARAMGLEDEVREELQELARLRGERAEREPEAGGWEDE